MATTVAGSPLAPFADAIYRRLSGDATLLALATGGVGASLSRTERTEPPYVVVGSRELLSTPDGGSMQIEGGSAAVTVEVFSKENGPQEAQDIQSRIRALLQRYDLSIAGYVMHGGSLICEDERVFSDFDPDMPERSGFHGVQRWTALLEEAL